MMSKQGIIGTFISTFVGTIVVVVILIAFAVIGGLMSTTDSTADDVVRWAEADTGLGVLLRYTGHVSVVEAKQLLSDGAGLEDSLKEAGWYARK